jgi:hypothetical protein
MISTPVLQVPIATARGRRQGVRHRGRMFLAAARRPGVWGVFCDDRRVIRLKLALLTLCVIGAGFLEVRW